MRQLVAAQPTPSTGMLDNESESKEQKTIEELQAANDQQRDQIDRLTEQLAAQCKQLDITQQRWHEQERATQEAHVQLEQEKQATRLATDKIAQAILQG